MPLLNVIVDLYHNDTVDPANGFHDMKDAGIRGIIHKATQGADTVDPEYDLRRVRARSVGFLWGSYHFGVAGDPVGQADHYLRVINPAPDEIMTLDFEPYAPGDTMTFAEAEQFVARVHDQTGRYPLLYSGSSFLLDQFGSRTKTETILAHCPLWVARYGPSAPAIPPAFDDFVLWQYTDGGVGLQPHTVPGVGRCDRNKFNGTVAALVELWGGQADD